MSRRRSLRRRLVSWFGGSGVVLLLVLVASAVWLQQAAREIELRLAEDRMVDRMVSAFQTAVLRELEAGQRYLVTLDPMDRVRFQRHGIEAFRAQQTILANSDGSPAVSAALAPIQRHLSIAEASLARAHRLAELGREDEVQEGLSLTSDHTRALLEGLEELEDAKARRREAEARRLVKEARIRGLLVVLLLAGGFAVVFLASRGTLSTVVESRKRLAEHADRLQQGDLDVRTDVEELPEELRSLGLALNEASRSLATLADRERALRRAEKLSAVGLLLSGVAHELNNPLASILITSEDLARAPEVPDDPVLAEGLQVIRTQAARARSIVRKLLMTVREDEEPEGTVSFEELEERIRSDLDARARRRGVTLLWEAAPDLPPMKGDAAGLETVLTNLVENAMDAGGEGGTVRVGAQRRGEEVVLSVEDDGPGIGPEVRSRIFDPFFTTRSDDGAVGLGLSVALGIVRSFGGRIEHENRPAEEGGGARFAVHLRAGDDAGRDAGAPGGAGVSGADPSPPESAVPTGPVRVLVVDDEATIRTTLRRVFERRGWEVEEAVDGRDALSKIREAEGGGAFDVVISDLKMPVMSGMELVDRLLTEDPDFGARLVIMTGDNVAPGPADFLERTALPVVDKPFELDRLVGVVEDVADGGRG